MSSLLTINLIQVLCSKSTVNYQLKTLEIVKFVTFLSRNDNMLVHMCSLRRLLLTTIRRVPPPRKCVLSVRNNENVGAIHSTKIQTGPTGKSGPPQKVDQLFSKLFRLDRTDPLSFGPKFQEILVEWIAPLVESIAHCEFHLVQTLRVTSLLRRGKFFWIDICAVQIYN